MVFWKFVIRADKKAILNAFYWLLWTIVGMLPLWLLFIPIIFYSLPLNLDTFGKNGEFALYSAGIISGSMCIIDKDYPFFKGRDSEDQDDAYQRTRIIFPNRRFLNFLHTIILMFSSAIFMLCVSNDFIITIFPNIKVNLSIINKITFYIFLVSIMLGFLVVLVENSTMNREQFEKEMDRGYNELEKDFDNLHEQDIEL